MKEYLKPEVELISFATEEITDDNIGISKDDEATGGL